MFYHTIARKESTLSKIKLSPSEKYGECRNVQKEFTYESDSFLNNVILGRFTS